MPLLSCFTPCGMLECSSDSSHAERFYDTLIADLGDQYDIEEGSRAEATCYAQAMGLAEARYLLEHAGGQIRADCLDEMMADREREYGIIPGPDDSMPTRRDTVAAHKILPRGARREAVEDALRTLLGSNFVAYRTTHPSEIVNWPTPFGRQPMSLQLPETVRKTVTLDTAISTGLLSPQEVAYTAVDPVDATILVGDQITIEPEILGIAETLTVSAVGAGTFTATFSNPHTAGCMGITYPWPMWTGSQRGSLIIVKATAAINPETRRKVNDLMERIARGVSTWAVVQETTTEQAGPFILDTSPLDATPFDLVSIP